MRLIASDISCRRGGRTLYDGVSFSVAAGELLLLTGPNGSGKTSLLRQIAGLLPLDRGSIACEGFERMEDTHFSGHATALKEALTVRENIAFWSELYGADTGAIGPALARLQLERLAALPARVLSAGQKRRLALARLVSIRRTLWLLDEPDTALDAEGRTTLIEIVAAQRALGGMIVMASHGTLEVAASQTLSLERASQTVAA